MRTSKFTICYRDKRNDAIHCEHAEARRWSEAAATLLEARVISEGFVRDTMYNSRNLFQLTKLCQQFEILFAFKGHQKQLI